MKKLTVVIPTYSRDRQIEFLARAMKSVQTAWDHVDDFKDKELEIRLGLDEDDSVPSLNGQPFVSSYKVFCGGGGASAAVNAAMRTVDSDWVALLEDDDWWCHHRLSAWWRLRADADFFSCTSLEVMDQSQETVRINDFPIPSGWIFKYEVWDRVGGFNESFRVHHDNEWLGRLAKKEVSRIHIVEDHAPIFLSSAQAVRPWLYSVLTQGGPKSTLYRSLSSVPLVIRSIHAGQGEARLQQDPDFKARSNDEYHQCIKRYGRISW